MPRAPARDTCAARGPGKGVTTPPDDEESAVTEQPQGQVHEAGEGLSDREMVEQVEGQTSSDLEVEDQFEAEAQGATSDREAAKDPGGVGRPT